MFSGTGCPIPTSPALLGCTNVVTSAAEQIRDLALTATYDPAFAPDGTLYTAYDVPSSTVRFEDVDLSDGFKAIQYPDLAIDTAGNYHVVWTRQGDPFTIEYRFSNDGVTWIEPERLSVGDKTVGNAQIEADRLGNVHLTWTEFGGLLYYRRWTPDGGWSEPVDVSLNETDSAFYRMTVNDEGLAHVIFNWAEMFYVAQQTDGRWSAPVQLTHREIGDPEMVNPDVAADAAGVPHFVWTVQDDTEDIYYSTLE